MSDSALQTQLKQWVTRIRNLHDGILTHPKHWDVLAFTACRMGFEAGYRKGMEDGRDERIRFEACQALRHSKKHPLQGAQ